MAINQYSGINVEISCDFCVHSVVDEESFADAKDVIDALGWKNFKEGDEWFHKCKECQMDDEEARAESIMERYAP